MFFQYFQFSFISKLSKRIEIIQFPLIYGFTKADDHVSEATDKTAKLLGYKRILKDLIYDPNKECKASHLDSTKN